MTKYKIELTEDQMRVVQLALEEWFRLRLGQCWELTNDLAFMDCDMSPDNPDHERIFDSAIQTRDALDAIMQSAFRIAFGSYGVPKAKTDDMLIAECIWDAVRTARGVNRWGVAHQVGNEPLPEIEVIKDGD